MDVLVSLLSSSSITKSYIFFVDDGFLLSIPLLNNLPNPNIRVLSYPYDLEQDAYSIVDMYKYQFIYFISSAFDRELCSTLIQHHFRLFSLKTTIMNDNNIANNINTTTMTAGTMRPSTSTTSIPSIPSITIFSSIAQDYYSFREDSLKAPYQIIKDWLLPIEVVNIYHLPLHVTRFLDSDSINIFSLTSFTCRNIPIYFHRSIDIDIDGDDMEDDYDVDIDFNVKNIKGVDESAKNGLSEVILRTFAHDLTSALLFNYGLDPTKHIYSLGRMSSSIGKHIQKMIGDLKDLRNSSSISSISNLQSSSPLYQTNISTFSASTTTSTRMITTTTTSPKQSNMLQPASLLIIDRTEDIFTPGSNHLSEFTPIAHRIFNTLPTSYHHHHHKKAVNVNVDVDIDLQPTSIVEQASCLSHSSENKLSTKSPLSQPFSALASLPLPLSPSLFTLDNKDNLSLNLSLLTESEENTRMELISILKDAISTEKGVLPFSSLSKKRGYGAEILAYIQALIVSPGNDRISSKFQSRDIDMIGYNPLVCLKYESIISKSYAIIESMQRSSAKQFSQKCDWKLSYEGKMIKENRVLSNIQKFGISMNGSTINNSSMSQDIEYFIQQRLLLFQESMRFLQKSMLTTEMDGPIDISFVLLQIIRFTSLFGKRKLMESQDSMIVNMLVTPLRDYILQKSPKEELEELVQLNVIGSDLMMDILSVRNYPPSIKQPSNENTVQKSKPSFDKDWDSWDPIGDDENDNDDDNNNDEVGYKRIEVELLDILYVYIDRILVVVRNMRSQKNKKNSSDSFNEIDLITSYLHSIYPMNTSTSFEAQNLGVIARSFYAIMKHRQIIRSDSSHSSLKNSYPMSNFQHMESSLALLKRAGLGLLSQGLGRLGLGNASNIKPHPGDNNIIVIFVVGGISFEEIGQIKQVLNQFSNNNSNNNNSNNNGDHDHDMRVIIGSNNIFKPETILQQI